MTNQTKQNDCGLSKRFMRCSFKNYIPSTHHQKAALMHAKILSRDLNDSGLILLGPPGTGKTHLAASIVNSAIDDGVACRYTTFSKMSRDFRELWREDAIETEEQFLKKISELQLLVIDDIGIQYGTQWEKNFLREIIDIRYQDKTSTVLISNLPMYEFFDVCGEGVIDRMRQNSLLLNVLGESYRQKTSQENGW